MARDEFSLEGKRALIIGASRGIGAATARAFVRHGARVVLASRDESALMALAGELRAAGGEAHVIRTDLGEPDQVIRAVAYAEERLGGLDVAFNNAGLSTHKAKFADVPEAEFHRIMRVNLYGTFVAMKYEIQAMLRAGGGSVINTTSIGGSIALGYSASYDASKHGANGLTKAAALDHARDNIRVNAVAPGPVWTEMSQEGAGKTPGFKEWVEEYTPMGRYSRPDEIASPVVWLASDASSYVTGAVILVDGGYTVK